MYNLQEGADHDVFLKWRTTEHQKENMGIPGVLKSDFYAVKEIYTHVASPKESLRSEPLDRKSTRLNSSHIPLSRMPSSA